MISSDKEQFVFALAPQIQVMGWPVDVLTIVAQAGVESRWGQSQLAVQANNLFGMKAGSSWKGATITFPTTEYSGGKKITVNAKFRSYGSYGECVDDFLKVISRYYPEAFEVLTHGGGQVYYIKLVSGPRKYATDPRYADTLNAVYGDLIMEYGSTAFPPSQGGMPTVVKVICGVAVLGAAYGLYKHFN